jgi:5S rRNA maturation endonuclease (ribonuclease M5)
LGTQIKKDQEKPLVVEPRHDANALNLLTKKEVVAYANARGIAINSRKKKEELIEIIIRS